MSLLQHSRRPLLVLVVSLAVLVGVSFYAVIDTKARILQALGPRASVGEISLSYPTVTLRDVRIAAAPGRGRWPADEEFHAGLVRISIAVGSLWGYRQGEPLVISDLQVSDGALVMLRNRAGLTVLPALRETADAQSATLPPPARTAKAGAANEEDGAPAATVLVVQHAHVERMAVDLYDATLPGKTPLHVQLAQVQGDVDAVALPTLSQRIAVDLRGVLKGIEHDGPVSIKGTLTPAAHDADLALRLNNVDLLALQPYLLRLGEAPVRHGSLDMTLDAHVQRRQLHAPGRLTLRGVELGEGNGAFAGVERRAVLATLARDGRIDMKFVLEGRTDDPKFSLNEKLALRIAAGLGDAVGVSVKGVVQGVGEVFKGLLGGGKGDKPAH